MSKYVKYLDADGNKVITSIDEIEAAFYEVFLHGQEGGLFEDLRIEVIEMTPKEFRKLPEL